MRWEGGEVCLSQRTHIWGLSFHHVCVYCACVILRPRLYASSHQVGLLSGGELQRFAIATVAVQIADVYMFDEPSSYLDVKQRLTAAAVIRDIVSVKNEKKTGNKGE